MADYLPTQEQKLLVWLNNFLAVANSDISSLGIPQADLTALQTQVTTLTNDVTNVASSKAAYEGNVQTKDVSIVETTKSTRALVRTIQNNPDVSDGLKAQLGITVPSGTRTKTAPVTPSDVLATPQASGINTLAWNVAGNKATTQYAILAKTLTSGARVSDDAGWTMVGLTTKSGLSIRASPPACRWRIR